MQENVQNYAKYIYVVLLNKEKLALNKLTYEIFDEF